MFFSVPSHLKSLGGPNGSAERRLCLLMRTEGYRGPSCWHRTRACVCSPVLLPALAGRLGLLLLSHHHVCLGSSPLETSFCSSLPFPPGNHGTGLSLSVGSIFKWMCSRGCCLAPAPPGPQVPGACFRERTWRTEWKIWGQGHWVGLVGILIQGQDHLN